MPSCSMVSCSSCCFFPCVGKGGVRGSGLAAPAPGDKGTTPHLPDTAAAACAFATQRSTGPGAPRACRGLGPPGRGSLPWLLPPPSCAHPPRAPCPSVWGHAGVHRVARAPTQVLDTSPQPPRPPLGLPEPGGEPAPRGAWGCRGTLLPPSPWGQGVLLAGSTRGMRCRVSRGRWRGQPPLSARPGHDQQRPRRGKLFPAAGASSGTEPSWGWGLAAVGGAAGRVPMPVGQGWHCGSRRPMGWGMQRDGERGMQQGGDGEWTPRGRSVSQWGVLGGCSGLTAPGLALAGRGLICPRSCEGARPERLSRTSRGDSRDHTDGTAPLSHGSPAAPGRWERARVGPPRIWGACGRGWSWPGCAGTGAPQGCPFPGLGPRSSPRGSSPAPAPSPPSVLGPVPSQCPHPAMPLPVPRPAAEPCSPSPSQSPTPGPSPAPRLSPCIPAAFASGCWAHPRPPRQYTPAPSPGPPGHPPVPSPLCGRSLPSAARCLPRCPPQWLRCLPRAPAQHPWGIPQPHPAARPAPSPGLQGEPPPRGTGGSQPPWGLFPGLLTPPGTHPCDRDPWGQ